MSLRNFGRTWHGSSGESTLAKSWLTTGERDRTAACGGLPKARERKRIPLLRIGPCLLDRKARVIQQGVERFPREFVAALGMDGFKGRELNDKLRGRDIYALIARALEVHLHP